MMDRLGLIGFGRFGQMLYDQISEQIKVQIYDPFKSEDKKLKSIRFSDLDKICKNPLIVIAVPVSALETVTKKMAKYIPPHTVVMDVCSVKKYPIEIMAKYLNEDTQILGTHPLFGPDSVKDSMEGHMMIMTPYRIEEDHFQNLKSFWKSFGIKIVEMSSEEQDKLMAWTLALTHFLGRGLNGLPLPDTVVTTKDFQNLLDLMTKINRDTWELFHDMHRYNPYAREMRDMLMQSMLDLKSELDQNEKYF
jgi:prephenate dehydrogenase